MTKKTKRKYKPWNKGLKGWLAHFLKRKRLSEKRSDKIEFNFGR